MWVRNLVFVAVLIAAATILRAGLFPLHQSGREVPFDLGSAAAADFAPVVRRIDEAFRQDWQSRGLTPAARAADLTVARRLSLALTGTVPSLEEIRQFEALPADGRLDAWTTYLLNDRRSADFLAERFARACVGSEDGPFLAYRKRRFLSWLSDELHRNAPYDALVRELVAAEGLNTDRPAVNFIAATYDDALQKPDPEKLAVRLCRAFLGLRLDFAQCHDHFLEPTWKQTDFQGIAAFFGTTRQVATHVFDGPGGYQYADRATGEKHALDPAVPFLPELLPVDGSPRERLAHWLTHPNNPHFARAAVNRTWAMLFNRPLRKHVEAQTLNEPAPPALDILAEDFVAHGFDPRRLIHLIAAAEVFRLDSGDEESAAVWASFPITRLRPEQVIGSVIQASSVRTINRTSHVVTRLQRYATERDFVQRYGDAGDDDFEDHPGTVPQRLLMMNGRLVNERIKEDLFNASHQVAIMAPDDRAAVDAAYLCALTRRPTPAEAEHFAARIAGSRGEDRHRRLADLFWVLVNSTEMSWNH